MDSAIIAAQPGYFVLFVAFGITPEDPPSVDREPVIGWKIERDSTLQPVCTDQAWGGAEAWAILYPDGKVFMPEPVEFDGCQDFDDCQAFDSIDAWLAFLQRAYEVEFASRAKES